MFEAMILITEITFVAHSHRKEKIHKYGHIHLDDILARRDRFRNEVIIAAHLSTRYTDDRIHRVIAKKIPDMLGGRLQVWL
jgi:ribonuclease Z